MNCFLVFASYHSWKYFLEHVCCCNRLLWFTKMNWMIEYFVFSSCWWYAVFKRKEWLPNRVWKRHFCLVYKRDFSDSPSLRLCVCGFVLMKLSSDDSNVVILGIKSLCYFFQLNRSVFVMDITLWVYIIYLKREKGVLFYREGGK